MITVEVGAGALGAFVRKRENERQEAVVKAIQETVYVRGEQIAQEVVAATKPLPVDRGTYRAKFRTFYTRFGAKFANISKHGDIVDKGRRPGTWPPRLAIEGWVKRKFGFTKKGAIRSTAFLVARKIAKLGIKGRNIMSRIEKQLTPEVHQAAIKAAKEFK